MPPGDDMKPRLDAAMEEMQNDVDALFDAVLTVPADSRRTLVEAMRYAAIGGGKRLRPLLTVSVAELFAVSREHAMRAGCAVEAMHVYSLIHDDLPCMDDDDMRRGKPTVHRAFDEATAVLAGDALLALAFELITDPAIGGDPFVRSELALTLAKASGFQGMAGGQMMDIAGWDEQRPDLSGVTRLQQLKTGALLGASVEMGMILGKVPEEGRGSLRAYARDIGLAFQIADDLLDVDGDEELAGKALRKDEEQGKQTFVTLLGADAARDRARILTEQARHHLDGYGDEAALLRDIADYIVERKL